MMHTKILATASFFPKLRRSNFDLEKTVETSHDWIVARTGIHARRVASADANETNSQLAFAAAQQALADAQISPDQIDFILYCTVSPDHIMPNTASILQHKLQAVNAAALDISAACSGFLYGLAIADAWIRLGIYKKILLVGSEVLSPMVNWEDRNTCILFGDGAGVALLGPANPHDSSRIYSSHLHANGSLADYFDVPAGGSSLPLSASVLANKQQFMRMKGKEIYKTAVRMLTDSVNEALSANQLTIDDIQWFIPHQANLRIIEAVAERLKFPMEKVILNLQEYGNTSAATVPTALDQAIRANKIKRGDLVVSAVFGAGVTYGSTIFRY